MAITLDKDGNPVSFTGESGVDVFRISTLKNGITGYIKFGMIPTRGVTISRMLKMAGEYTGKTYKRGEGEKAVADLGSLLTARIQAEDITRETASS